MAFFYMKTSVYFLMGDEEEFQKRGKISGLEEHNAHSYSLPTAGGKAENVPAKNHTVIALK